MKLSPLLSSWLTGSLMAAAAAVCISDGALAGGAPSGSQSPKTNHGGRPLAQVGPLKNIFYIGDSMLDDGNYKSLSNSNTNTPVFFSNGQPWGTIANTALGLPAVGRWTSEGNHSPLGTNYAVSAGGLITSSTSVDTSQHGQISRLLSDYQGHLPANSLVVVASGANDVIGSIVFGGVWSSSPSEWKLGATGFTVPAANSSVTVAAADTKGIVAGPNNLVAFTQQGPIPVMMALTGVDPNGNKITLTNKLGAPAAAPGTAVPANAPFVVCGKWLLDRSLPTLATDIKSLEAAGGHVIVVPLPPTDLLPRFNHQPEQALAHETWRYFYQQERALIPNDPERVLTFDLKPIFEEVFSDPARYGFKFNYTAWVNNTSHDPNEYMFADMVHPSGLMHRYIAKKFVDFLHAQGLPL